MTVVYNSRIYRDMFSLQCGISLLFVLGQSLEDNITFVSEGKSWLDAKDYCFNNSQVLESDEAVVKAYNVSVDRVWLGYFQTYTPWAAIIGCYELKTDSTPFKVSTGDYRQCQRLCPQLTYEYFAFKGVSCYCLTSLNVFKELQFKSCVEQNNNQYNFIIYKQNIEPNETKNGSCMSAECRSTTLVRVAEPCNLSYRVICVDGTSTLPQYLSYDQGVVKCKEVQSYIKWYPDNYCSPNSTTGQHWTSARMTTEWMRLNNVDKNQSVNPLLCRSGVFTSGHLDTMEETNCSTSLPFFCTNTGQKETDSVTEPWQNGDDQTTYHTSTGQKETDSVTEPWQNGDDQTTYHTSTGQKETDSVREPWQNGHDQTTYHTSTGQKETDSVTEPWQNGDDQTTNLKSTGKKETDSVTGIAIGTVVSVVVIAAGIVVGIVFYKRRRFLDKASANTTGTGQKPSSDHGKRTTTCYQDIDPNQLCSNKNKNATNLVYFSQPSHNKQSQNAALCDMPTSSKHKDIKNSDQNKDVSLKTKIENTTRNKTTNTSDYCFATPCLDHEEIDPYTENTDYDHLNNVSKKETVLSTLKVYDHLPTSVDSDPTYDRADIKMVKAKNGNYDSFTIQ